MKQITTYLLVLFGFIITNAQTTIGDNALQISIQNNADGAELQSITHNGIEIMEMHSYLFYLYLTNINTNTETRISATSGWGSVTVARFGMNDCAITFANPTNVALPNTLSVNVVIHAVNGKSQWDLIIDGIGNLHTLTRVNFPKFKIKTLGNDTFFIPKFSGKEEPNPNAANIDYDLTYPRGRLGASMPFAAYYNDNYGIYLGFHDPDASLKNIVIASENNYVKYYGKHNIPNKTLPDNNWELPGVFEFDIFDGNWYEAAMIYKDWAQNNANYFPPDSPARTLRQKTIGDIAIWGTAQPAVARPVSSTESDINDFIALFPPELSVGIHWYKWYPNYHDEDYPAYFPERNGLADAINRIQQGNDVVMPYINGMMYDTDLPDFPTDGQPYATKRSNGTIYSLNFSDTAEGRAPNTFAIMCPTQTHWQDTIVNINAEITNRLNCKGVYNDMVGWAGAFECMDASHGHPLATGHWWHDGYQTMYNRVQMAIPNDRFLTVEGATDNLTNVIDGFLVGEWRDKNLVPAFQTIYGGKNQFFGVSYGGRTYNDASFYTKFSSYFVNNIQPGRMFLWFAHDANAVTARPYIVNLAVMRHKLRNFMSYGTMLKPFEVTGVIPDITSNWGGNAGDVTVSALQKNVFINKTHDTLAFVFSNASMTDNLNFTFDVNGTDYGFTGTLDVQLITQSNNGVVQNQPNTFTQSVSIAPMTGIAYLVSDHDAAKVNKLSKANIRIYPNPATDIVSINSKDNRIKNLSITNISGQIVYQKQVKGFDSTVNISNLSKGVYFLNVVTEKGVFVEKIIKQ